VIGMNQFICEICSKYSPPPIQYKITTQNKNSSEQPLYTLTFPLRYQLHHLVNNNIMFQISLFYLFYESHTVH
jgi:hypothetical protein